MVVSELQHRLDELNVLKLREPISHMNTLVKNSIIDNVKRCNPFDCAEQEPLKTITFIDLHEQYGRMLRDQFHYDDQEVVAFEDSTDKGQS